MLSTLMKEPLRSQTSLIHIEGNHNLVFMSTRGIKIKRKKIWTNLLNSFCKGKLFNLRQVSCSNKNLTARLFLAPGIGQHAALTNTSSLLSVFSFPEMDR